MGIPHKIRRSKIRVQSSDQAKGQVFSEKIKALVDAAFMDELDAVLSEFAGPERIVRLPSLHLELGKCSEAELEQRFKDYFLESLAKELSRNVSVLDENNILDEQDRIPVHSQDYHFQAALFYVQNGILPWWYDVTEIALVDFTETFQSHAAKWKFHLLEKKEGAIWQRFIHIGGRDIVIELMREQLDAFPNQSLRSVFDEGMLVGLKDGKRKLAGSDLLKLYYFLESYRHYQASLAQEQWKHTESAYELLPLLVKEHIPELDQLRLQDESSRNDTASSRFKVTKKRKSTRSLEAGENKVNTQEQPSNLPSLMRLPLLELEQENGIGVSSAGIILLHSFIPTLFRQLSLLDDGGKVLVNCEKAISVLYYLTHGTSNWKEYEVSLFKILLGQPLHTVMCEPIELTAEEKSNCDQLLQAVIEHWSIVGKISINGLRESFLMRNGILKKRESSYYLHVERKSYDMLVDQLPWTISIVRLPWMLKIVYTEW